MSVPITPPATAIPRLDARAAQRDSVHVVDSRVARFFVTLWIAVGAAIVGGHYLSVFLGAPKHHPREYPFIAGVYLLWIPFVPLVIRFARRWAPVRGRRLRVVLIHLAIGLAVILVKHVAHRMIFCGGFPIAWLDCVTAVRFESWLVHWVQTEYFVFAATVGGVWAFDAKERAHRREWTVLEKERELAAAELQAEHGHLAPRDMSSLLGEIIEKLRTAPAEAEQRISRAADFLRATVQSMRVHDEPIGVDLGAGPSTPHPAFGHPLPARRGEGRGEGSSLLAAFPLLFAIGWTMAVVEVIMRYNVITPLRLAIVALQVAIWLAPLPLAFLALDVVLRRTRSAVLEAIAIALFCLVSAVAAQVIYGGIAWSKRWYQPDDVRQLVIGSRLETAMRLATRRLESPILIAAAGLLIGRFLVAQRQERERELRETRLETRLAEARLQLLRSQLNPHFLFNALNSAMALVRHDPRAAEEMLARLARFYEITSATEGRMWIALAEEIGFAREYLDIEQVRFGARLRVEIDADDGALQARVPALLLQPIVENAIKHGIARTPGPGWIRLRIDRDGEAVRVMVENRGPFDSSGDGVGLTNTRERLRQAFGDAASLRIESQPESVRVIMTMEAA